MASRRRPSARRVALAVCAAVAMTAAPAAAGAVHSLPGKLVKYLGPNADEVARRALQESGQSAPTAVQSLGRAFSETRIFVDEAAARALRATDGNAAAAGDELAEAAAVLAGRSAGAGAAQTLARLTQQVASGGRVHRSLDEVVTGLMIMAKQIDAAKRVGGQAALRDFPLPREASELLQAVMQRTKTQREMLGGVYRDAQGFYLALDEVKALRPMLEALKAGHGGPGALTQAWRARVLAAFDDVAAHGEEAASLSHRIVRDARKQGDAAFWRGEAASGITPRRPRVAGTGDALPTNKAAKTDEAAAKAAKADEADDAAATAAAAKTDEADDAAATATKADEAAKADDVAERLAPAAAEALRKVSKTRRRARKLVAFVSRADRNRPFYNFEKADADVTKHWEEAMEAVRRQYEPKKARLTRQSPFSEELREVLQRQQDELAELRRLNGGRLPRGTPEMTLAEKETLGRLNRFFDGGMGYKPVRDWDGYYYSGAEMEMYQRILDGGTNAVVSGPQGLAEWAFRQVLHADTQIGKALRARLDAAAIRDKANAQSVTSSWDKLATMLQQQPQKRVNFLEADNVDAWIRWDKGGYDSDSGRARALFARLRTGEDFMPDRQELAVLRDAMDSVSSTIDDMGYRYYAGYEAKGLPTERDVALTQALFRNNLVLRHVFGDQWAKPTGAAANHVSDRIKHVAWD